jgi:hypothetical protein
MQRLGGGLLRRNCVPTCPRDLTTDSGELIDERFAIKFGCECSRTLVKHQTRNVERLDNLTGLIDTIDRHIPWSDPRDSEQGPHRPHVCMDFWKSVPDHGRICLFRARPLSSGVRLPATMIPSHSPPRRHNLTALRNAGLVLLRTLSYFPGAPRRSFNSIFTRCTFP